MEGLVYFQRLRDILISRTLIVDRHAKVTDQHFLNVWPQHSTVHILLEIKFAQQVLLGHEYQF